MPADFIPVKAYVYPFIDETTGISEGGDGNGDAPPGSQDGSPQPRLAAGGSAGGNNGLWDELFEVQATVTNTARRAGIEVAQLVSLFAFFLVLLMFQACVSCSLRMPELAYLPVASDCYLTASPDKEGYG